MDSFKNQLALYFVQKAPALPAGFKSFIVAVAPWLMIIFVLLAIPSLLAVLGISAFALPAGLALGLGGTYYLSMILTLVAVIMQAIAIPALFKKGLSGWNLVFYATLVSIVGSLFVGAIVNAIISFIISMYILFQVKSYYH